jgi:energy-coupling factor transport system permease protein
MISSFVPGMSYVHHLNPLTKLTATMLVVLSAYLIPWILWPTLLVVLLVILSVIAHVQASYLRTLIVALLPLTFSIFVIQGLLFPPAGATSFHIGPITLIQEGLFLAYWASTRLLAFSAAMLLLLRTTHPTDLTTALTERGLPRSIGYILLVSLQIVPDMAARATAILEVQRSRGLKTEGVMHRVTALVPLVGPLIIGALVDVEERAMAIDSRAFLAPGPKTSLRVLIDSVAQQRARTVMLLVAAALIIWRIATVVEIRIV